MEVKNKMHFKMFIRYLKNHNAYKKFTQNVGHDKISYWNGTNWDRSMSDFLDSAFTWDESPQGFDFWCELFKELNAKENIWLEHKELWLNS